MIVRRIACYGRFDGPLAVAIPVGLKDDVDFKLVAELSRVRIGEIVRANGLRRGWSATIVDEHRTILLEIAANGDAESRDAPLPILDTTDRLEGAFDRLGTNGKSFITAFSQSRVSNVLVQVQVPQAELLDELYRPIAVIAAAAMLTLGLGLYLSWRVADVISRSVSQLTHPALALGTGQPFVVPDSPLKETHALGKTLTQAAQMLRHARYAANHDSLTGLCNRAFFEELGGRQVLLSERTSNPFAVLMVDLDEFKRINDTQGHSTGDRVLTLVAQRVSSFLRNTDVAARLGGDEFVLLLPSTIRVDAVRLAEQLVEVLSRPFPDVLCPLSASIGLAIYPQDGKTLSELMLAADQALYRAKSTGKRRVSFQRNGNLPAREPRK